MKPPALVSWNIRIPFVPVEPEPMFVQFTRSIEAWISKVVLELEESLNWNSPFVPKPWGTKGGVPATLDVRRSMLDVGCSAFPHSHNFRAPDRLPPPRRFR